MTGQPSSKLQSTMMDYAYYEVVATLVRFYMRIFHADEVEARELIRHDLNNVVVHTEVPA